MPAAMPRSPAIRVGVIRSAATSSSLELTTMRVGSLPTNTTKAEPADLNRLA